MPVPSCHRPNVGHQNLLRTVRWNHPRNEHSATCGAMPREFPQVKHLPSSHIFPWNMEPKFLEKLGASDVGMEGAGIVRMRILRNQLVQEACCLLPGMSPTAPDMRTERSFWPALHIQFVWGVPVPHCTLILTKLGRIHLLRVQKTMKSGTRDNDDDDQNSQSYKKNTKNTKPELAMWLDGKVRNRIPSVLRFSWPV